MPSRQEGRKAKKCVPPRLHYQMAGTPDNFAEEPTAVRRVHAFALSASEAGAAYRAALIAAQAESSGLCESYLILRRSQSAFSAAVKSSKVCWSASRILSNSASCAGVRSR